MNDLKIELFSEDVEYDLTNFDCGEEYLNTFLTDHLKRQHNSKILRGYMLVTREEKPRVMGYYTLLASSFEKNIFPVKRNKSVCPTKMSQV